MSKDKLGDEFSKMLEDNGAKVIDCTPNPPAQDQPVTPEAEGWAEEFVHQFVNNHNQTWRPLRGLWVEDVIDFIRQQLKSAHNSEVEEVREKLKHIRMFHHAFEDSKEKISLYEVQDVLDILTSLSPNQHKE